MNGWLILDKPSGMTSKRACGIAARAIGAKTFGHVGTLDPMASGLLPVAFGEATKMIPYLETGDRRQETGKKEYLFSVKWGIETDTLDITGKTINTDPCLLSPISCLLGEACRALTGEIWQTPPQYSAVHVDGRRAYEIARAGKTADIPPRRVTIYELEHTGGNDFRVVCSAGTYVRVLAQQIAEKCRVVCTVSMIRRVRTNGFEIKDAVTLDFPENLVNNVKPVDFGLGDIPVWNLDQDDAARWGNGGFVTSNQLPVTSGLSRVYCDDKFLGIGEFESGVLKPRRVII